MVDMKTEIECKRAVPDPEDPDAVIMGYKVRPQDVNQHNRAMENLPDRHSL
ncbi:MAG: hypothetical protein ACPGO3_00490 [Magnetospiraceae bacterium]